VRHPLHARHSRRVGLRRPCKRGVERKWRESSASALLVVKVEKCGDSCGVVALRRIRNRRQEPWLACRLCCAACERYKFQKPQEAAPVSRGGTHIAVVRHPSWIGRRRFRGRPARNYRIEQRCGRLARNRSQRECAASATHTEEQLNRRRLESPSGWS
jgi:hypothetical protein